jgi:hypothetical protein
VRRLGTDGAAENKGRAAATAYRRKAAVGCGQNAQGKSSFIAASTGIDGTARGGG